MSYIIALANEKGGVAKTTTVVSLAGALVEMDHEVLVIDLDAQANLTLALGVNPADVRRSITDLLLNSAVPLSASRETTIPGLDLIPATSEMNMAERFLPVRQNYQVLLQNALHSLQVYDFILLDCPPSLGAVTLNALTAAHLLVIPTQAEFFSAHALLSTITAVRRVRTQHNPGLAYRILITMIDRRNRIHRNLYEQLHTTFGKNICQTTIETDTKLRECPIVGLPITHYSSRSRSAMQYRALAEEIKRYAEKSAPNSTG
jgi:chromosome partitioning protein